MTERPAPSLYVIVDPDACGGRDAVVVAGGALRGGASILQLRSKSLGDAAHLDLARALRACCAAHGAEFVVNDRVDLALLARADEVHLGQDDLAPAVARTLAPRLRMGRSTHDLTQVDEAIAAGCDRIAFGPVFSTRTKADASPVVGVDGLRAALGRAGRPLVAIGGFDVARCREVARLGLEAVATISAVCGAEDPERAASELVHALRGDGAW